MQQVIIEIMVSENRSEIQQQISKTLYDKKKPRPALKHRAFGTRNKMYKVSWICLIKYVSLHYVNNKVNRHSNTTFYCFYTVQKASIQWVAPFKQSLFFSLAYMIVNISGFRKVAYRKMSSLYISCTYQVFRINYFRNCNSFF